MKKTKFHLKHWLALAFVVYALPSLAQNELDVAIIFGAPSAQCSKTGICQMYILADVAETDASFDAIGKFALHGSEATLTIQRASMTEKVIQSHFYNITFVMSERFVLPSDILAETDWPETTIVMGEYEYEEIDETLVVYFHSVQH